MKINELLTSINPENKKIKKNEKIYYLDTSNITKNNINEYNILVAGKDKIPSRAKRSIINNDIIYSTVRPNNMHFGFLKNITKNVIVSTGFTVLRVDPNKANPRFIYDYLTMNKYSEYLHNIGEDSTSTYPAINPNDLASIEIDLPPRKVQDRIADVSSKIDDLIDYNKKINLSLETITKKLYKSWFIDFNLIKLKDTLSVSEKNIDNLLPDTSENTKINKIPKGWHQIEINSFVDKISNMYNKEDDWSQEKLIDLSRMPKNSISLHAYGRGKELTTSICKFKKYDFLFGSIRPYFYKAGICPFNGVTNSSVFILRPKNDFDREFLYFSLSSEIIFKKSVQYSDGTKMPVIKWDDFKKFKIILPDKEIRKQFSKIVNPIIDYILLTNKQNQILSDTKDKIISKFISSKQTISALNDIQLLS